MASINCVTFDKRRDHVPLKEEEKSGDDGEMVK